MDARAAREASIVFAQSVVVPHEIQVWLGTPENLPAEAGLAVRTRVGLPAVDEPRLDLQLLRREILNAKPLKNHGVFDETKEG